MTTATTPTLKQQMTELEFEQLVGFAANDARRMQSRLDFIALYGPDMDTQQCGFFADYENHA